LHLGRTCAPDDHILSGELAHLGAAFALGVDDAPRQQRTENRHLPVTRECALSHQAALLAAALEKHTRVATVTRQAVIVFTAAGLLLADAAEAVLLAIAAILAAAARVAYDNIGGATSLFGRADITHFDAATHLREDQAAREEGHRTRNLTVAWTRRLSKAAAVLALTLVACAALTADALHPLLQSARQELTLCRATEAIFCQVATGVGAAAGRADIDLAVVNDELWCVP